MSCNIEITVDLIDKLENITNCNPFFNCKGWVPYDTDRLRSIVVFLEKQEDEMWGNN